MKETSAASKMRVVAGFLYAALSLYQMFINFALIQGNSLGDITLLRLYSVLMVPGAAAMAVWMFAKKEALSLGARRGVITVTALAILFEMLNYSQFALVVDWTLAAFLPSLQGSSAMQIIFIAVRFLLMILAAFFVSSSRGMDYKPEKVEGPEAVPEGADKKKYTRPASELDKPLAAPAQQPKAAAAPTQQPKAAAAPAQQRPQQQAAAPAQQARPAAQQPPAQPGPAAPQVPPAAPKR